MIPESSEVAVAVTGIGVLTPLGDSVAKLMDALCAGQSSVVPVQTPVPSAQSIISDFEATHYANVRGMRIYNRSTRLGICATRLALVDAGLENSGFPGEQLGVVMASTFGHLDTLIEYDRSLFMQGPSRTNPALMPLAIPSAPGALIALSFGAKACSITLADGGAGGLDALGLGARLVRSGRTRACVVVAALGHFDGLILSSSRAGLLAPSDAFRVFDKRSQGTAHGEGAVALVLESAEDAQKRGAMSKGFVTGQASTFTGDRSRLDQALGKACAKALRAACVEAGDIGLASSGANGIVDVDRAEALALLSTFDGASAKPAVTAVKAALGETLDVGGLLQVVVALSALAGGLAPPISGLRDPAYEGLRYLPQPRPIDQGHALVTSTSRTGSCSAVVLSRDVRGD